MRRLGVLVALTLVASAVTAGPARAAGNTPLVRWAFETAGTTTPDLSGSGHDGTVAGGASAIADGRFDAGLTFPSTGPPTVAAPASSTLEPANVSVLMWVRRIGGSPLVHGSLVTYGGQGCNLGFSYGLSVTNSGNVSFGVKTANGAATAPEIPATSVWDDAWHAVAGTYDGTTVRAYLDGNEIGSGQSTTTGPLDYSGTHAGLSAGATSFGNCTRNAADVDVDDVRVYDHDLGLVSLLNMGNRFAVAPPSAQSQPSALNPVFTFHLDAFTAQNRVLDASGHALHGHTATGSIVSGGRFGSALSLNGTTGFAVPGAALTQSNTPTVLAWVKRSGAPAAGETIVHRNLSGCVSAVALETGPGGGVRFSVYQGGSGPVLSTPVSDPIWDGSWHAVAGVARDSGIELWVDGEPASQANWAGSPSIGFGTGGLSVGRDPRCASQPGFDGFVDEVSWYRDALDHDEIGYLQSRANTTPPSLPLPDLRLRWHLDGAGATQADDSGLGLDGTAANTTALADGRFAGAQRIVAGAGGASRIHRAGDPRLEPSRLTFAVWVRHGGSPGAGTIATYGAASCGSGASWSLTTTAGGDVRYNAPFYEAGLTVPGAEVWDGRWHLLAVTAGGSTGGVYLDGTLVSGGGGFSNAVIGYGGAGRALDLGAPPPGCGASLGVDLDEAQLYRGALAPAELRYLARWYHQTAPSLPIPANDPGDLGLAARYHLNSLIDTNTLLDSSGNDAFGTAGAPSLIPDGRFQGALRFNAFGDGFTADGGSDRESNVTALAWVRGTAPGNGRIIVGVGQKSCGQTAYGLDTTATGGVAFHAVRHLAAGGSERLETSAIPAVQVWDGQWHAVAGTFGPAGLRLFLDGQLVTFVNVSGDAYVDYSGYVGGLGVGHDPDTDCVQTTHDLIADVDEVRLYGRALDDNEVSFLQNSPPSAPRDLPAPSPTPTATPSATPTATSTATPTPTATPTATPIATPTPPPSEPEPGLALKWHLDTPLPGDPASNVPDASGNGLDGTLYPTAERLATARFKGGVTMPADPDHVETGVLRAGDIALQTPKVTLVAWVRSSSPGDQANIVSNGVSSGCHGGSYGLKSENGAVSFYVRYGPTAPEYSAAPEQTGLWDGQWHALLGSYDGTTARLYVDGAEVGAGRNVNRPINYQAAPGQFVIGNPGSQCDKSVNYAGDVDEVRVYDRALSAGEAAYLAGGYHRNPPTLPIPADPLNTARPTITGTPKVGATLTCAPGTWNGAPTFTYLWERAPRGVAVDGDGAWFAIDGAGDSAYVVAPADAGSRVRCRVIATNGSGMSSEAVSRGVRTDADVPTVHVDKDTGVAGGPTVSGDPIVGHQLTCNHGTWDNGPDERDFRYQWTKDGVPIASANGATYTPTRHRDGIKVVDPDGDGDHVITCVVTAGNDVGTSAPVAATALHVVDGPPAPYDTYQGNVYPGFTSVSIFPNNEPNPLKREAQCNEPTQYNFYGKYNGYPYQYQWLRWPTIDATDPVPIAGATGEYYKITADDIGRSISCRLTMSNPAGSTTIDGGRSAIPLPAGDLEHGMFYRFRPSENDPTNLLAVSQAFRQKAAEVSGQLQQRQIAELSPHCPAMIDSYAAEYDKLPPTSKNPGPRISHREWSRNALPVYQHGGPLSLILACKILVRQPQNVHVTKYGTEWFGPGINCKPINESDPDDKPTCHALVSSPTVDAQTSGALPQDLKDQLAAVTPTRVLWDVDNDGYTDLDCPGSSPVLRSLLQVGRYNPLATLVYADSATTGRFTKVRVPGELFSFPNATTAKGTSGRMPHDQSRWCRSSLTPPPDPAVGPCTQHGEIGAVQVQGNMCPISARGMSQDDLDALPSDIRDVVKAAAKVINDEEELREKALDGYSPGYRSADLRANPLGTPAERDQAAAAYNTVASITSLGAATQVAAGAAEPYETPLNDAMQKLSDQARKAGQQSPIDPKKAQFALDQIYVVKGDVKVNGVLQQAQDQANKIATDNLHTIIAPSEIADAGIPDIHGMTITNPDALQQLGQVPLSNPGRIRQEFTDQLTKQGKQQAQRVLDNFNLEAIKDKLPDLGPFDLTGADAKVTLNDDGTATLSATAEIPFIRSDPLPPDCPSGCPATAHIELKGDLDGHLEFEGVRFKQKGMTNLGAIRLKDLDISYQHRTLDASGGFLFPPGNGGIDIHHLVFDDGGFRGLDVDYLAPAGVAPQIFPGIFLVKLGGGLHVRDSRPESRSYIKGSSAISALSPGVGGGCPTVGASGDLDFQWDPTPFVLKYTGAMSFVCVPLASMGLTVWGTGKVHLDGGLKLDQGPLVLNATLFGDLKAPNWQIGASGHGGIKHLDNDIDIEGIVSNKGLAGCAKLLFVAGGASVDFNKGLPPLNFPALIANLHLFTGCDISDYKVVPSVGSRAADGSASQTFRLPARSTTTVLSFEGAGAAPRIHLKTPGGADYDFTGADDGAFTPDQAAWGAVIAEEDRTVVELKRAAAGLYTVSTEPGAEAVARMRGAVALPQPKVKVSVSAGSGPRRRLRYDIARIKGQTVRLVEVGGGPGINAIKTIQDGGKGTVGFTASEATGTQRRIEAQISQDGRPRKNLTVATFTARSPTIGRVPHVRARRRKGSRLLITWGRVPMARSYSVVATSSDSSNRMLTRTAGQKRSVTLTGVGKGERVRVAVIATSAANRRGPAGRATVTKVKPKRHKHRK